MPRDKNGLTLEEFLMENKKMSFEKPSITVDNLLFTIDELENDDIRKLNDKRLQVLLVKRDEHPYIDTWSLPGVFMGVNETLREASMRSLNTKANISGVYLEQLYTFDDVNRDPRTRVLSVAYMGLVDKKATSLSDIHASWFTLKTRYIKESVYEVILTNDDVILTSIIEIKNGEIEIVQSESLGFDHIKIIYYGLMRLRNKLEYTDIAFSMLPSKFTLTELQQVFEVILDKKFTKANFQRKIKGKVTELDDYKSGGFRPTRLYKYEKESMLE